MEQAYLCRFTVAQVADVAVGGGQLDGVGAPRGSPTIRDIRHCGDEIIYQQWENKVA